MEIVVLLEDLLFRLYSVGNCDSPRPPPRPEDDVGKPGFDLEFRSGDYHHVMDIRIRSLTILNFAPQLSGSLHASIRRLHPFRE